MALTAAEFNLSKLELARDRESPCSFQSSISTDRMALAKAHVQQLRHNDRLMGILVGTDCGMNKVDMGH